jgi:hypothetical protein
MGLISEVKCNRCDRHYSGLRGRCPYCGARRRGRGKRVADGDNALWKLVIGVLLLLVLIAAVMILIFSTLKDREETDPGKTDPGGIPGGSDGVEGVDGGDYDPTTPDDTDDPDEPDEPVEPAPPVSLGAEKVSILAFGSTQTDFTMKIGESWTLSYKTVPASAEGTAEWSTSDESVFVVLQNGKITAIGKGDATLTLKFGDVTATSIVRVK